jgi:hypothetical protein
MCIHAKVAITYLSNMLVMQSEKCTLCLRFIAEGLEQSSFYSCFPSYFSILVIRVLLSRITAFPIPASRVKKNIIGGKKSSKSSTLEINLYLQSSCLGISNKMFLYPNYVDPQNNLFCVSPLWSYPQCYIIGYI